MEVGQKYEIITHPIPGVWLKPRRFIGVYLGTSEDGREVSFSLRPLAGTTSMREEHISSASVVNPITPPKLPEIYRGTWPDPRR